MRIYTLYGTDKQLCDHQSWQDLIDDGWQFVGMKEASNHVLMTRRGYINEFWTEAEPQYSPVPLIRPCQMCGEFHDANRGPGNHKAYCEDCEKEHEQELLREQSQAEREEMLGGQDEV